MATWQNSDGLYVRFGQDQARETNSLMAVTQATSPERFMRVKIAFNDLPTFTSDLNNDGTKEAFTDQDAYIPAGSYITGAWFIPTVAFAGGTSYDIGLYTQAGAAINASGIDSAMALAEINATTKAVNCDGALVNGEVPVASDAYLVAAATGTFTAGEGVLFIRYLQITP